MYLVLKCFNVIWVFTFLHTRYRAFNLDLDILQTSYFVDILHTFYTSNTHISTKESFYYQFDKCGVSTFDLEKIKKTDTILYCMKDDEVHN